MEWKYSSRIIKYTFIYPDYNTWIKFNYYFTLILHKLPIKPKPSPFGLCLSPLPLWKTEAAASVLNCWHMGHMSKRDGRDSDLVTQWYLKAIKDVIECLCLQKNHCMIGEPDFLSEICAFCLWISILFGTTESVPSFAQI